MHFDTFQNFVMIAQEGSSDKGEAMSDDRTFFNEMLDETGGPRECYSRLAKWLEDKPSNFLTRKSKDAETIFRRLGITFAVYGAEEATERLIPFDPIPRIISAAEWRPPVSRHRPACARAERFPARHLSPSGNPARRADPGRPGAAERSVLAGNGRLYTGPQSLFPYHRHRPCPGFGKTNSTFWKTTPALHPASPI